MPRTKKAVEVVDGKTVVPEGIYDGTVRVVTEADILGDPRLVAASAVVGQLYDFSNLPYIPDGRIEDDVQKMNEAHDRAGITEDLADKVITPPPFSSEADRRALGVENPEEKPIQ